jgi:hypothetical protein
MDVKSLPERRNFRRMRVNFNVEIFHPMYGVAKLKTWDMSDGGIFILVDPKKTLPPEGTIVSVKVKGLLGKEDPVVDMKVVRDTNDGVGLSFL